jgi:hypothetical protein
MFTHVLTLDCVNPLLTFFVWMICSLLSQPKAICQFVVDIKLAD